MRLKILPIIAAWLLLSGIRTYAADDFRGFAWGAAMSEVLSGERAKPKETRADYVVYRDEIAGHKVLVMYNFDPAFGFYGADYGLDESYADPDGYIDAFTDFGKALAAEFGEGDLILEWVDRSLESEYKDKLGQALADGRLKLQRNWITERTSVYLIARGDGGDVMVSVHYYSMDYLETAKEEAEPTGPKIQKKKL